MRWATAITTSIDANTAVDAVLAQIAQQLEGEAPDLLVAFTHPDCDPHLKGLFGQVQARWPRARLIGCTAAGVIGDQEEIESAPSLAITAASLPGVQIEPFHVLHRSLPEPDADASAWRALLGVDDTAARHCVLLPDPFSMDVNRLVRGVEALTVEGEIIGGTISGGQGPGEHRLLLDDQVLRAGAVGVFLSGNIAVQTVVSQGCRPVGAPCFVTRCRGNVVAELDGEPAFSVLGRMLENLDPSEAALCREALFVGLVMEPDRQAHGAGDFLIRYLIGVDARSGALVISSRPQQNAVLQFHVRDAAASSADLALLLQRAREQAARPPAGALLFDCVGRGENFFGMRGHDSGLFRAEFGAVPVGGFFCSGEIGPVRGRTYVHGYTASVGLFRPRFDS